MSDNDSELQRLQAKRLAEMKKSREKMITAGQFSVDPDGVYDSIDGPRNAGPGLSTQKSTHSLNSTTITLRRKLYISRYRRASNVRKL